MSEQQRRKPKRPEIVIPTYPFPAASSRSPQAVSPTVSSLSLKQRFAALKPSNVSPTSDLAARFAALKQVPAHAPGRIAPSSAQHSVLQSSPASPIHSGQPAGHCSPISTGRMSPLQLRPAVQSPALSRPRSPGVSTQTQPNTPLQQSQGVSHQQVPSGTSTAFIAKMIAAGSPTASSPSTTTKLVARRVPNPAYAKWWDKQWTEACKEWGSEIWKEALAFWKESYTQ